jgi:hypothetical protein
MSDRASALRNLAVGDIFHARSSNRASLVCLVTAVDETTIHARRIHTQDDLQFDQNTGLELGKLHTRIDCVAPLPPDIHNLLVEMDRKYQALHALVREGVELDPEQCRLTPDERRANGFNREHVAANPI